MGWRTEKSRFVSRQYKVSFVLLQFFLEPTQHIQWEPQGLPRGKEAEALSLTTHLHLMSRLRISGSISSLPHMPSWLQHRDNLLFGQEDDIICLKYMAAKFHDGKLSCLLH